MILKIKLLILFRIYKIIHLCLVFVILYKDETNGPKKCSKKKGIKIWAIPYCRLSFQTYFHDNRMVINNYHMHIVSRIIVKIFTFEFCLIKDIF